MSVIRDAHTHFFSRVFFETLARQAPGGRVEERLRDLERGGLEVPDQDHMALQERWLERMDEVGVESMVSFASVPEEAEVVAEIAATSGGRITGYVVANLALPGAADRVEHVLGKLGLRGVVLFPAMHHYSLSDPACAPALERVHAHRGVVVAHCGVLQVKVRQLLGLADTFDARFASPLHVVRAASAHPGTPFVIPHLGGGMLAETLLAGHWCPNILVDTSSSNGWLRALYPPLDLAGALARALDVFGPQRILFGTDSSTFPRGYRSDLLEAQVAALDAIGVAAEERALILGGNLKRLLGTP